jgi:hypothetical protein
MQDRSDIFMVGHIHVTTAAMEKQKLLKIMGVRV